MKLDASSAECLVFTAKEGLLSPVAHDLKIRVTRFALEWDGETLTARFEPRSLRVLTAMKRGREAPDALGKDDRKKIERSIVDDVLHPKRYPRIEFRSSEIVAEGEGFRIRGELTLHGVTRAIRVKVKRSGERWCARIPIRQSDYGIEPFTAMLGTLKVKPGVRVEISVPVDAIPDDPLGS